MPGWRRPPTADSIRVVSSLSWRYQNPAYVVARRLGLEPRELAVTTMGGNSPQALVNATARQILAGELDVAILVGGEAWRTRMRARRDGVELDWPRAPDEQPPTTIGSEFTMNHQAELDRGIVQPVQVYPMFDTAIRAASGRSPAAHLELISEMWSRFSDVAAANPNAWSRRAMSAVDIRTPIAGEPHGRAPVHEVHELQQRRRHGRGADHVLGRSRRQARCRRRSLGVPAQRHRLPRARVRVAPRHVRPHAGDRDRWPAGARPRRCRDRRRGADRPVLVLPVRRAARRDVARPRSVRRANGSSHAPAGWRSPAGRGTTT